MTLVECVTVSVAARAGISTSSPVPGRLPVLQLPGVFHVPPLALVHLTSVGTMRFSSASTESCRRGLSPCPQRDLGFRIRAAVRAPVPTGSVVDLVCTVERPTSVEEVNQAFAERADSGPLEGILRYTDDPIVSTDIVNSPYSSIFDSGLTMVVDERLVHLRDVDGIMQVNE